MNNESWRDIPDYETFYQASNMGRVRSLDRITKSGYGRKRKIKGRILSQSISNCGYNRACLSKEGKKAYYNVHRLVISAFKGESSETVDHSNGNRKDNRLENLRYMSMRENISAGYQRRGKKHDSPTGVQFYKGKWKAHIRLTGKLYYIGLFTTPEEAQNAYFDILKNGITEINKYKKYKAFKGE